MSIPESAEHGSYRYELVSCNCPLIRTGTSMPSPHGSQIVLRVAAAGVCHTDLHLSDGYFNLGKGKRVSLTERGITLPHTLGHENVGEVIALGPDATGVAIGDHVLVYPWAGCGSCEFCGRDQEHLCGSPEFVGVFRKGGFGSHLTVSHPRYLFKLTDLPDSVAAPLACSGLTAYSAIKKIKSSSQNEPVVIVGAGGLGLMCLSLLALMGRPGAVIIEPDKAKRDVALQMGALAAFDPKLVSLESMAQLSGGATAVLDFVGSPDSIAQGVSLLRKGGQLIAVGMYGGELSIPIPTLILRAITLEGSYVGSLEEMRELMALVERAGPPAIPIVTRPMSQVNEVFAAMRAGELIGRAVLQP